MKKVKSLIMLVVLLVAALFVGCAGQDSIDSGFKPIDDVDKPVVETPSEVLDEELISTTDEVEIGELI